MCAAEEAVERGWPSPSTTPTGGERLEPARPVSDLHVLYPHLARAQPSTQDLAEWRALASRHESTAGSCDDDDDDDDDDGNDDDDDSFPSPPSRLVAKADGADCTPPPKPLSLLLSPALIEDSESIDGPGRRVQFSSASPRVRLIPACAGAIRRPGKRSHRRRQLSTASRTAMQASFAT